MGFNFFRKVVFIAPMCVAFFSCMKQELPVPLKPKGEQMSASADIKEDYQLQVFYSLKNNAVVATNKYTSWDLGFEAAPDGWHIILNGAKFRMVVYPINKSFDAVQISDTIGINSLIDAPSGNLDSTAFGDWQKANRTFVLHRGTDENGKFLGMAKVQILSVDATKYVVRFANIDGTNDNTIELLKDDDFNFVFLSLDAQGKIVHVEPPKKEWDIVFTKYTHFYADLNMRYSVVGCLLNPYQTIAGRDSSSVSFESLDLGIATKTNLSNAIDRIGFEWKTYDIDKGKFTVDAQMNYIIRCGEEGIYYKLRFIDFYKNGVKGNAQFEFQRL